MKRSKSSKFPKKFQLYFLLGELGEKVNNQDDLGILVGYSVINSLSSFNSRADCETRRLEEARKVCEGLDGVIVQFLNSDCDFDSVFYNLKERVNPVVDYSLSELKRGIVDESEDVVKNRSEIFRGFLRLQNGSEGNYGDCLRRSGINLQRNVKERGYLKGDKRVCQRSDFNDLYLSFAERR
jgi:hypothetical protein